MRLFEVRETCRGRLPPLVAKCSAKCSGCSRVRPQSIITGMIYGVLEPGHKGISRIECDPQGLEGELEQRAAILQFEALTEEEFDSKKEQYEFKPEW